MFYLITFVCGAVAGSSVTYFVLRNNPKLQQKLSNVQAIIAEGKLDADTLKKLQDALK